MSGNTKIEWADHTFNPWEGCQKVGPGCDHCYAEARNARFGGGQAINWGPGAPRRRTSAANWRLPIKWNAQAAREGRRFRVFCASLADVFDNQVPAEWRVDLLRLIAETPHLDWLLLTKRIGNAHQMMVDAFRAGWPNHGGLWERWNELFANVWLGATVVNQEEADRDIPKLLAVPARVRFLSIEPMLGPITVREVHSDVCEIDALTGDHGVLRPLRGRSDAKVHWVICGGESGPKARPMHPDWTRTLRDQCAAAGVPFLFKQWGEHALEFDRDRDDPDMGRCAAVERQPGRWINLAGGHGFSAGERVHYAHKVGKKAAGRLLDGIEHNGFPT
jgi:protein gp37